MARPLLSSEYAVLRVMLPDSRVCVLGELQIIDEHFSRPRTSGNQWFNTDFMLQFVDTLPTKRKVESLSIRQSSIGADLFYVLDEESKPARLELLGGEAFPKKYYENELRLIDDVVSRIDDPSWTGRKIRTAPFLRVFDFEERTIFLASTVTDVSPFASKESIRYTADSYMIHTRAAPDGSKLIEGVIASSRKPREDDWVLYSV